MAGRVRRWGRRVLRPKPLLAAGVAVAVEAVMLRRRTGTFAGNVVVQCRRQHLFTTLWVPGVSVKALRFGWWRFQWCPVGRHWAVVTPVDASTLSPGERIDAVRHRDIRLP